MRKAMNYRITWMRGRALRVCKRTYSERVGAISPSKKKDILMVIKELSREEPDKL
jgi:hypothetical protein